jgi:hypothetical protein
MAIADARPGVVLAVCALAAGVVTPIGVWQWLAVHKSSLGGLTVSVPTMGARQLDARWTCVVLGVLVAISYSALAGITLVLSRRARRPFRNAITLAMLPVFFALAWVAVRNPR